MGVTCFLMLLRSVLKRSVLTSKSVVRITTSWQGLGEKRNSSGLIRPLLRTTESETISKPSQPGGVMKVRPMKLNSFLDKHTRGRTQKTYGVKDGCNVSFDYSIVLDSSSTLTSPLCGKIEVLVKFEQTNRPRSFLPVLCVRLASFVPVMSTVPTEIVSRGINHISRVFQRLKFVFSKSHVTSLCQSFLQQARAMYKYATAIDILVLLSSVASFYLC
jgi:hypothetical protein